MGKHERQWKLLEKNGKQKHKTFPNQTIVLGNLESGNGKHSLWSDWEKNFGPLQLTKLFPQNIFTAGNHYQGHYDLSSLTYTPKNCLFKVI